MHEGWKVSAVDVNESLMERWGASPSLTTFGRGIRNARFPDASFDIISMSHVIEHLATPVEHLGYSWGFYFSDFKRYCVTGRPRDCAVPSIEFRSMPIRHKLFGYFAWALR